MALDKLQQDWKTQYDQDLGRIQENLNRSANALPEYQKFQAGDKMYQSAQGAYQGNQSEAEERINKLLANPEYGQLEKLGVINRKSTIDKLRGLTPQEQTAKDESARQGDIQRATEIGQQAGTLAPGQQAASQLNAPATPIPPSKFEQGFNAAKGAGGTPAQATNANNGVYKDAQNNVFKADGTPIDLATFKQMGLNIDHINTKDQIVPQGTEGGLTSAQGKDMVQKYTPSEYNGAQADAVMMADKAHQQYVKDFTDSQTSLKQGESLVQEYDRLTKDSGIQALDMKLLNMRNILDGTEEDIRNEVTKAGGFATNSQVLALTNARNKTMIQNYNNLLQTRENMQNNIKMKMGLSEKDRAYALEQVDRQLNFDQEQIKYADKMLANAQDSLTNSAKQMGWNGILQAALATGDPDAVKRINSTMGGGFDLNTAAEKELQELQKEQKNYESGIIGEYQFYSEQELAAGKKPVSFNEYQNLDANRKLSIARAGSSTTILGGGGGSSSANGIPDLNTALQFAISGLGKDQRNNATNTFNSFMKQGKTVEAQKYVERLLRNQLPAGAKDDMDSMDTVSSLSDDILKLTKDGNLEGIGIGTSRGSLGGVIDKVFGNSSTEARQARIIVGNIKGTVAKLRGGTSFTPNEQTLLDTYTPTINDNPKLAIEKVRQLQNFIATKRNKVLYGGQAEIFQGNSTNEDTEGIDQAKSKYGITY